MGVTCLRHSVIHMRNRVAAAGALPSHGFYTSDAFVGQVEGCFQPRLPGGVGAAAHPKDESGGGVPLGALRRVRELGKGGFGRVIEVELPRDASWSIWGAYGAAQATTCLHQWRLDTQRRMHARTDSRIQPRALR